MTDLEKFGEAVATNDVDVWAGNLVDRDFWQPAVIYIFPADGGVAVVPQSQVEDFEFCFPNAKRLFE